MKALAILALVAAAGWFRIAILAWFLLTSALVLALHWLGAGATEMVDLLPVLLLYPPFSAWLGYRAGREIER